MPNTELPTNTSPESTQAPQPLVYSRRDTVVTGVKILVFGGISLAFTESGQFLQVIFPPSISQETATTQSNDIILTAEQLKNGVNLVVFGDSIPEGFQGYTDDTDARIQNPLTPFAGFMDKAVQEAELGRFQVDVRAQQGATGQDIYNQVCEYRRELLEAKKQGKYVNKPTLFIFSMNGNSYREVLSDPAIYSQAQSIDHQGFLQPQLLNLIPPFDDVSLQDKRYAENAFYEMSQTSNEGLKVLGLIVLGPYDFGGVPSMEFIPTQNEDDNARHTRTENVPITVFNLFADENARRGAHLVSLAANKSLVDAYNSFRELSPPFPTEFISMLGLERYNNGTEHLNMYGCFLLACLVMSRLKYQIKFGRKVNLLEEAHPTPPLSEIIANAQSRGV